jgi:hypothetical protein
MLNSSFFAIQHTEIFMLPSIYQKKPQCGRFCAPTIRPLYNSIPSKGAAVMGFLKAFLPLAQQALLFEGVGTRADGGAGDAPLTGARSD